MSQRKHWIHRIYAPQTGTAIDPLKLNEIYNSAEVGVNEQHLMTFGRELNQRNFDLGMAGLHQITDLEYLAKPMFESHCTCYAGKLADREDRIFGLHLIEQAIPSNREETHAFFRKWHSFDARLRTLSDALGEDLTRGKCIS